MNKKMVKASEYRLTEAAGAGLGLPEAALLGQAGSAVTSRGGCSFATHCQGGCSFPGWLPFLGYLMQLRGFLQPQTWSMPRRVQGSQKAEMGGIGRKSQGWGWEEQSKE